MTEEEGDEASGCQKEVDEITRRGCLFFKKETGRDFKPTVRKRIIYKSENGEGS